MMKWLSLTHIIVVCKYVYRVCIHNDTSILGNSEFLAIQLFKYCNKNLPLNRKVVHNIVISFSD